MIAYKTQDHLGNRFTSAKAMCKFHGVSVTTFYMRRKNGLSDIESLQCGLREMYGENGRGVVDHNGVWYASTAEMASEYGVSLSTFFQRKNRGFSLKDCLVGKDPIVYDFNNTEYPSLHDMCKAYAVSVNEFRSRIMKGASLRESLTGEGDEESV